MVNCFADNTVSQDKPELVATSTGQRAVGGTSSHFLWDWICPSRPESREYCKKTIRDIAEQDVAGTRLDSVCFPCESYCDCAFCTSQQATSGLDMTEWRAQQIESFVREIRESVSCGLGLTLEPDPCFGKERFGLDLDRLQKDVDFIFTPLYMDYSIVYWLDTIAYAFRKRMAKPYFIELYAGHPRPPTKQLVSALAVASGYADCVILSTYENKLAEDLRREMVGSKEIWKYFEEHHFVGMVDALTRWQKEIR